MLSRLGTHWQEATLCVCVLCVHVYMHASVRHALSVVKVQDSHLVCLWS